MNVITLTFVLLVDQMLLKEELKFASLEHGVLSVMISGELLMLLLYVTS